MHMDVNDFRIAFTVGSLCIFVGIVVWVYARSNRAQFEEAGKLPLADD